MGVVICMMIDLFIYQTTLGTYTWVYIGQVAEEMAASLAIFTIWFFVFILALTTDSLFDGLGNQGTFWFFSGLTLVGGVLILITHKETKGLSDEEIKVLFVPENLKKQTDAKKSDKVNPSFTGSENTPFLNTNKA